MLVKSIIKFLVASLTMCSCSVNAAPIVGRPLDNAVMKSQFCKKYKCSIELNDSSNDSITYNINFLKSSQKTLFQSNIEGSIVRSLELQIGIDYPENGMSQDYSELVNDFNKFATGTELMPKSSYYFGGPVSICYRALADIQLTQSSVYYKVVKIFKGSDGRTYITKCGQLPTTSKKQTNRFIRIEASK